MDMDLTQITWQTLTTVLGLSGMLVVLIEVVKRVGLLKGSKAIFWAALVIGQLFAQIAFARSHGCSLAGAVDAGLVGILAAIAAIGGHTVASKLIAGCKH